MQTPRQLPSPIMPESIGCDPAARYARVLLRGLGYEVALTPPGDAAEAAEAAAIMAEDWAQSGLMPLCGRADESPRRAHHAVPSCARGALDALRAIAGPTVLAEINGATLLSERAAYHQWRRRGQTSVNGHCHLLRTSDDWICLNLARTEDIELLPAWLSGARAAATGELDALRALVRQHSSRALLAQGQLLGLPLAIPGEHGTPNSWMQAQQGLLLPSKADTAPSNTAYPRVLDLSALWAGPLCTHLLQAAGAQVLKVESPSRPDASRLGLPDFYRLLNDGKAEQQLEVRDASGRAALLELIRGADIVVESARPRALQALGIDAASIVREQPGLVWLRITGHGNTSVNSMRVGFGDDAAIAGGAGLDRSGEPMFCGDALADPLTGLHAALAAWAYWQRGQGALLDLSLAGVTAWCVGFARELPCAPVDGVAIREPATRVSATRVPATRVPATRVPATRVSATRVPATRVSAVLAPDRHSSDALLKR